MKKLFDNRLRPAFEFLPATVLLATSALLLGAAPQLFPMMPGLSKVMSVAFLAMGLRRATQGFAILRYRAQLSHLPRYALRPGDVPRSRGRLFLGRGFAWDQRHRQRMIETQDPGAERFLRPRALGRWVSVLGCPGAAMPTVLRLVRSWRHHCASHPLPVSSVVGGNPCLHGVGLEAEHDVWMELGDRTGHTLVMGTTRVGKTRLAELLIAQDVARGDTVIVLDPKGDVDLLRRVHAEAARAGRLDRFHLFHLGHPAFSERYNPIGDFGRITEIASRIAAQLPAEGDSAAFREFAWRFTNIVARALAALGRRPVYADIARHLANIEPLLIDYHEWWLHRHGPPRWREAVEALTNGIGERSASAHGRSPRAVALARCARANGPTDAVADGLRAIHEYDRSWFEKVTAGLPPLLEKLVSGPTGALLAPDYGDLSDARPILDWRQVIRERGIVYVGLDALSDPLVAGAVGNSMFADLTSVAGRLYKFGDAQGLPRLQAAPPARICIHADEFSELVGDEFVPLLNKGGGAGLQITAYTQTASDIEAGIGDAAKAGQIAGNLGTLIMLRVRSEETAELLTRQLPKVRVYTKLIESRTTDDNHPETPTDFTSANADRLSEVETELLHPSDLVQLPKGQAFALLDGGRLYKLRLPLPEPDPLLAPDVETIGDWACRRWAAGAQSGVSA